MGEEFCHWIGLTQGQNCVPVLTLVWTILSFIGWLLAAIALRPAYHEDRDTAHELADAVDANYRTLLEGLYTNTQRLLRVHLSFFCFHSIFLGGGLLITTAAHTYRDPVPGWVLSFVLIVLAVKPFTLWIQYLVLRMTYTQRRNRGKLEGKKEV